MRITECASLCDPSFGATFSFDTLWAALFLPTVPYLIQSQQTSAASQTLQQTASLRMILLSNRANASWGLNLFLAKSAGTSLWFGQEMTKKD